MATYSEIQEEVRSRHGFAVKTWWIAQILNEYGLNSQTLPALAPLQPGENLCPANKRRKIEATMRVMGVLPSYQTQVSKKEQQDDA